MFGTEHQFQANIKTINANFHMIIINFLHKRADFNVFPFRTRPYSQRSNKALHNTTQYEVISAIEYWHSIGQLYFSLLSSSACVKVFFFRKVRLCLLIPNHADCLSATARATTC